GSGSPRRLVVAVRTCARQAGAAGAGARQHRLLLAFRQSARRPPVLPSDPTGGTVVTDEASLPTVLSATTLSNGFLGKLIEICFVTADHRRTMEGLVRLGIGPWRVYTFDSATVTGRTYRGEDADYAIKVCFADVGDLAVEIMQPLYGPSIFQEFLDTRGEGIQHVAFDCDEVPWAQRAGEFERR